MPKHEFKITGKKTTGTTMIKKLINRAVKNYGRERI
jgi:hypothetical protein